MAKLTVAKNAISNIASFFITALITFLILPVMLKYLGEVGFGIWAIVRVFVSYLSLGDLGLNNAVTKFIAEFKANNDDVSSRRILQSAFFVFIFVTVFIFVLFVFFRTTILELFFLSSGEFHADVAFILFGSLLIFSFNLIFSIFPASLNGIQRMDITNGVTVLYSVVNAGLMYAALIFGLGLRGLLLANAISTFLAIALNAGFFFVHFRDLKLFRFDFDFSILKKIIKYSKHLFISALANAIHLHFDKLLISSMLGLSVVSSYEIASRVIQQIRQIPILALNPLMPASSEIAAKNNNVAIAEIYKSSLKYLVALIVPLFGLILFLADPLITLWLGENNRLIILTLQILLVSNFINILTGPSYFISLGIGKVQYTMYSSVIGLVLNVILSYVLIKLFGYYGAVWGTFFAFSIASLIFLIMVNRALYFNWNFLFKLLLHTLLPLGIGIILSYAVTYCIHNLLMSVILNILIPIVFYIIYLTKINYFDSDDKEFARRIINRLQQKFFAVD